MGQNFWLKTSEKETCMCREPDIHTCKKDNKKCILVNITPLKTKQDYLEEILDGK